MRPLKLDVEGFTAFRQPVCLDLAELDLFAITGPTGAGKSSLIDAICYALYGRVPRITNEVTALISQNLDRMRVSLEFAAGAERYRIFRETRRKGTANVRLERMRGDGWQPLADRVSEVTARINEIVGLDYEGFIRSVLLPQGQFQEFLAGSAERRRAVLGSLLRLDVYNRMRAGAGTMASELKTRLEERDRELAALAEATPEHRDRLQTELCAREDEVRRYRAEATSVAAALELAAALSRAQEHLAACEEEAGATRDNLAKTAALVATGDKVLLAASHEIGGIERKLAENCYDADRLTQLTLARSKAQELMQSEAAAAEAKTQHTQSKTAQARTAEVVEKSKEQHAGLEEILGATEAKRSEAQRHNLVAALASGLKPGDACPVCGSEVGQLQSYDGRELEQAEKEFLAARKAESESRSALQNAFNMAARAAAGFENAEKRLLELESQVARQQQELASELSGETLRVSEINAALQQQTQARVLRERLEAELKQTQAQESSLRAELEQAKGLLSTLETQAAAAEDALRAAGDAAVSARDALLTLAAKQGWQDLEDSVAAGADPVLLLRKRADHLQVAEREAATAIGQIQVRIEHIDQEIERVRALRTEIAGLRKQYDVADDLARMLMANRFQSFLQQEALTTLAADGSRRLEQLSAGRYRLQVDEKGQDFEVIDQWNADQTRSVRTLSGGETFLASLSLALALAESLPGLAASRRIVLDSVFLDEGFGSLDPEALERAAEALDALRSEERMVCIVTHLQDLAQRLPARIVVSKTEYGSSVAVA
jgi:DNA repair protein SbcC/Rad50